MYGPGGTGGLAKYTYDLCDSLADLVQLTLATSDHCAGNGNGKYSVHPIWQTPGSRLRNTPASGRISKLFAKACLYSKRNISLVRYLKDHDKSLDIFHCQFFMPLIDWPSLLQAERRLPVVFTVHNVNLQDPLWKATERLEESLLRKVLAHAAGLIVHSPGLVAPLREWLGDFSRPISCIPLGVPLPPTISAEPEWLTGARRRFEGKFVLLQFGGVRPVKGLEVLLEALTRLPDHVRRTTHLMVVGETAKRYAEYAQGCRDVIRTNHLEETVTWIDRYVGEEELPSIFSRAHAAVFPYRNYLSSSAALSWAYALRVPAIASNVGGLGEYVRRDEIGLCHQEGNAGDLAECIIRLQSDSGLRLQLRENLCRINREGKYSWNRCAVLTESFYRQVLSATS